MEALISTIVDSISNLFGYFASWQWSVITQSITSIGMLYIAYRALNSWKHQQSTHRVIDFLDQLTDTVHDFVNLVSLPVTRLKFIKIGIESTKWDISLDKKLKHPELVKYVEKNGVVQAEKLISALDNCNASIHRIRSLLVKGQVLGISNYEQCVTACEKIIWQFDRLQVVYAVLSSPNLNLDHPEVEKMMEAIIEVTPESINDYLAENQRQFLTFVKNVYEEQFKL